jgi:hypothetical protein
MARKSPVSYPGRSSWGERTARLMARLRRRRDRPAFSLPQPHPVNYSDGSARGESASSQPWFDRCVGLRRPGADGFAVRISGLAGSCRSPREPREPRLRRKSSLTLTAPPDRCKNFSEHSLASSDVFWSNQGWFPQEGGGGWGAEKKRRHAIITFLLCATGADREHGGKGWKLLERRTPRARESYTTRRGSRFLG